MIEFYQAYADYRDLMDLTEALFRDAGQIPIGATCVATLKAHGESFRLGLVAPGAEVEHAHGEPPAFGVWVGTRRMDFGPGADLPEAVDELKGLLTLKPMDPR